ATLGRMQKQFALEQANVQHEVLTKFFGPKSTRELEQELEKTRNDEIAKKQTLDLELKKAQLIERDRSRLLQNPLERKLFSLLDEVAALDAKLPRLTEEPRLAVEPILASIASKLDEAERAMAELQAWRTGRRYQNAAARVISAERQWRDSGAGDPP